MRAGGESGQADHGLITLAEAGERVAGLVGPIADVHELPLAAADGHVLAADLVAPRDLPSFAHSAVDGYAVRFADLAADAETVLPVLGRSAAGDVPAILGRGAWRISTGAPPPADADTVVVQEDVALKEGEVVLPAGIRRGAHLRLAGEDIARGTVALSAGHRLRPQDLGLLAALGLHHVAVRRRPRVALFSTGNELAEPGQPLGPGSIYDANRAMLRALLARAGADTADLGILRDEPAELERHLPEAAGACDLIITSGGVSVGEADHVKDAVAACGSLDLWRIAIKPGKPLAIGKVAGTRFIGLPGNPVAVFVGFCFVARALIARLAGETLAPPVTLPVTLGFSHRKKPGRREFLGVSLETTDSGSIVARRHPGEGAGSLASLTQSDGLVMLAEDAERVEEGSIAPFLPYAGLFA